MSQLAPRLLRPLSHAHAQTCSSRVPPVPVRGVTVLRGPSSAPLQLLRRLRHSTAAAASGIENQVLCSYSHEGRVATVTFNRPTQLNAMTVAMGEEFQKVVEGLERVENLRAVVLTGAGRAFSAGGDLKFLLARPDVKPADNSEDMRAFYNRFLSIRKLPVPLIAAINGPAVGAGLCIAMACDIRVCAADAKLSLTFCNLGIHPGMGATYFLPKLVGFERAAKMLLTGETVLGRDARALGLVSTAVEDPEHSGATLNAAHELAAQIANLSPVAIQQTLRTLRQTHDEDLSRALWREADSQALCYGSAEYKEAITAFAANMKKAK